MQRRMPRWHLFALPRDNNSSSAKRAAVLSGRSPPRVSHAAPEASPPLFVRQGQGTKCWVIHIKLSGWKRLQMLLFLCLVLSPRCRLFSLPLHLVSAGCQGAWRASFLKAEKTWPVKEKLRPWLLHLVNWAPIYFLCLYGQKYKVNSLEVNGFIFSCARQSVRHREPLLFVRFTINANIY